MGYHCVEPISDNMTLIMLNMFSLDNLIAINWLDGFYGHFFFRHKKLKYILI